MRADFLTISTDLLRDERARVSDAQLGRALDLALAQYGKDRPRRIVRDETLSAASRLDWPADGNVSAIEHPIGSIPPSLLPRQSWQRYDAPAGAELIFPGGLPAGTTIRLTILGPHLLTDETDTVPDADREAVASYAAALLFDQMAADTSGDGNPLIAADAVAHGTKPDNYARRAERLRARYFEILGLDPKRTRPASVTVSQPTPASDGGRRVTQRRPRL
ncbi:hypothetical protein [Parvibaculum sp.]|uniref:hypothetical protein n=1 Tax=Parvibaculum sp. TaxID=2024848 RepID=UPI00273294C7|nr:hypothetical protein [Parvibaculum sp.]MDP3329415.1 hypothetical protein [Parvibaculum sp.]